MIGSKILSKESKRSTFNNTKFIDYISMLRKRYLVNNKVLLVQAPQFLFNSFNTDIARNRGYYAYPPTGLQWIAESLKDKDIDSFILDLNYEILKHIKEDKGFNYLDWLSILDKYIEKHKPSVIGVTCINIYTDVFKENHPLTLILEYLREKDSSIIISGGPIATNEYFNYLDKGLSHFIVTGEGENKASFFFDYLLNLDRKKDPIRGIYFKYKGKVEGTDGIIDKVFLKGNIIDSYRLVNIEDYNKVGSLNPYSRMVGKDKRFSVFQLNRGCRANCAFCGVTEFMGRGTRHFPVKDVIDEVTYLVEKRGILHFDVLDDDFLVNKKEIVELLEALVRLRKKHDITWSSNNGLIAVSITDELMGLMRDSGCVGFRIGVESGCPEMLKKMKKPTNTSILRKIASILNRHPELFTGGNYIIGLLGKESFGDMMKTFRFMNELNLDWASIALFQFTSSSTTNNNLLGHARTAKNFVPSKDNIKREILLEKGIVLGPETFELEEDIAPSYEQLKEIWFSFNLVTNYINNKNLKEGGRPEKFTSWVEAVNVAYPNNPYMYLFSGLGRILMGDIERAKSHLESTKMILDESDYWRNRFSQFKLKDVILDFPGTPEEAKEILANLRERYLKWVSVDKK